MFEWLKGEKYYTPEQGRKDALDDISNGKLIIKVAGRQFNWSGYWIKILREHNIQYLNKGCRVYDEEDEYIKAYNEIQENEIKRIFGEDFLDKTQARAIEIYTDKNS